MSLKKTQCIIPNALLSITSVAVLAELLSKLKKEQFSIDIQLTEVNLFPVQSRNTKPLILTALVEINSNLDDLLQMICAPNELEAMKCTLLALEVNEILISKVWFPGRKITVVLEERDLLVLLAK